MTPTADRARSAPLPPLEIAERAGPLRLPPGSILLPDIEQTEWWDPHDPMSTYEGVGQAARQEILSLLPDDWSFEGKRVLDFGCGAGRVLRHFLAEAEAAEVWGCDIYREGIEWLEENLSPPLRVFESSESPPLPLEDGSLDLVWGLSVFTHLTDSWSAWMLELHRVLSADGLLIATFCGKGAAWAGVDDEWDEDKTGMNVLVPWKTWEEGGPNVYHSVWWIRAHWGRAFEILELRPDGFAFPRGRGHGVALLRKRPISLTVDDLERDEPDEPRERAARRHNLRQLRHTEVEDDRRWLSARMRAYEESRSWRLTRPLRALGAVGRRLRPRKRG